MTVYGLLPDVIMRVCVNVAAILAGSLVFETTDPVLSAVAETLPSRPSLAEARPVLPDVAVTSPVMPRLRPHGAGVTVAVPEAVA